MKIKNALRTIWKVIKTIAKVYGIATVGMWAFIGVSNLFEKIHENPGINGCEADQMVFDDAFERFERFFTN